MSGGYFSHRWALSDIAEEIDKCVLTNKIPNEWDEVRDYPDEVLQKFSETAVNSMSGKVWRMISKKEEYHLNSSKPSRNGWRTRRDIA